MNRHVAVIAGAVLTIGFLGLPIPIGSAASAASAAWAASPSLAHHRDYYGDSARSVANHIDCERFRRTGGGVYHRDSGVCTLRGKRVSVITFRGSVQQREWNAAARLVLPRSHWWANGKGALVTAENGNKAAARAGARALPGKLVRPF